MVIRNLYWCQRSRIGVENELPPDIEIIKGVKQDCILFPLQSNLYSEVIFKESLLSGEQGIVINGKVLKNIRFADDIVITTTSIKDLQLPTNCVCTYSEQYGF